MPRSVVAVPAFFTVSFAALLLTGCPLSDRYYVEKDQTGGSAGADSSSTNDAGGGSSGGGSRSTTGGVASTCEASSCDGTCCGTACVDLSSDENHCGRCDNACAAGRSCRDGQCFGWTVMAAPPSTFVARERAAYATVGDQLFVFGGLDAEGNALNDGALYDPAKNGWTLVPVTSSTPSPRQLASAVWTGKTVYVVGGTDGNESTALTSGSKFDPMAKSWTPLPDLTTGRVAPYLANAVNAGHVLVWGGLSASGAPLSGGGYCAYFCSSWTPISTGTYSNGPGQLSELTWGVGNNGVFLFGGRSGGTTASNNAYQYLPANYQWSILGGYAPDARWGAFGTWDGQAFYVWGGRNDIAAFRDGSRFVAGGGWAALGQTNAPTARWAPSRKSGWMFALGSGDIVMVGGTSFNGTMLTDGGRYDQSKAEWSSIESWPSGENHEYGVAVAMSGELFVWGGRHGTGLTTTGERYLP